MCIYELLLPLCKDTVIEGIVTTLEHTFQYLSCTSHDMYCSFTGKYLHLRAKMAYK